MVNNDFYVAQGKTLSHKTGKFTEGRRFPAADLGLDQKSFDALVRDKSIVPGKVRNAFVHPKGPPPPSAAVPKEGDGLEDMSKADLLEMAHKLGLEVVTRSSKDEVIAAIRGKT